MGRGTSEVAKISAWPTPDLCTNQSERVLL